MGAGADVELYALPYILMSVFGSVFGLVIVIFSILYAKGKLKPRTFKITRTILGIVMLAYGVYLLSVRDILKSVYPEKHFSVGGWIAISLGIIIVFLPFLWKLREKWK